LVLRLRYLILIFSLICSYASHAQLKNTNNQQVIQFSGKVVGPDENGEIMPLPYTTVAVKNTSRGSIADADGFFSFVALKGEKIVFSRIGYKDTEFTVPDTLSSNYYTWIQVMSEDEVWLNKVAIYPWPSKEHFKQEFLAIDISNELRDYAALNMAKEVLSDLRYTVPVDGREASSVYIRQQAEDFKYTGQYKPQRIFDVFAWKKFIEAWKNGDFKKKKKKGE
jgi:hypothetical protein